MTSTPMWRSTRVVGWLGAALPLAIAAALVVASGAVWMAGMPDALGSPRVVVIAAGPAIVPLFAALGAMVAVRIPVRFGSLVVLAVGVGTFVAGRASPAVRAVSPWQGGSQPSVATLLGEGSPAVHLIAVVAASVALLLATLGVVSTSGRRVLLGTFIVTSLLAVGASVLEWRNMTRLPSPMAVESMVSGAEASDCERIDGVRVCVVPGWSGWREHWATTAARALAVLPGVLHDELTVTQSAVYESGGFAPPSEVAARYVVPPLDTDSVYVGFSHDGDMELIEGVAAWLVGLPTAPRSAWHPGLRVGVDCLDDSDAAAVALWIAGQADTEARQAIVSSANAQNVTPAGNTFYLGSVHVGPAALNLGAALLEQDPGTVADLVTGQIERLRQRKAAVAEALGIPRLRTVPTDLESTGLPPPCQ